jgi:hypothetical protein
MHGSEAATPRVTRYSATASWNARNFVAALQGEANPQRTYKVVVIKDDSGDVVEIRNREVEEAG